MAMRMNSRCSWISQISADYLHQRQGCRCKTLAKLALSASKSNESLFLVSFKSSSVSNLSSLNAAFQLYLNIRPHCLGLVEPQDPLLVGGYPATMIDTV